MAPQSIGISFVAAFGGALVSKTGRYKWTLVAGPALTVASLILLTRIGPTTGGLDLAPLLILNGFGLGLIFPNLTLTVQNASPLHDLGIATSTANFFRSMGGAFGAAAAGAVVATKLDAELLLRLGTSRLEEVGGAQGLIRTPRVVKDFAPELRQPVVEAVSEAVVSIIWRAVPVMAIVLVLGLLTREKPLRTSSAIGGED